MLRTGTSRSQKVRLIITHEQMILHIISTITFISDPTIKLLLTINSKRLIQQILEIRTIDSFITSKRQCKQRTKRRCIFTIISKRINHIIFNNIMYQHRRLIQSIYRK